MFEQFKSFNEDVFEIAPFGEREHGLIKVLCAFSKDSKVLPITWRVASSVLGGDSWFSSIIQSAKFGITGELAIQSTMNAVVKFCSDAVNSDDSLKGVFEGKDFDFGSFIGGILSHSNEALFNFSEKFKQENGLATRVIVAVCCKGNLAIVGSQPLASFLWRDGKLFAFFKEDANADSNENCVLSGGESVCGFVASTSVKEGDILILSNMKQCKKIYDIVETVMNESRKLESATLSSRAWQICSSCADAYVHLKEDISYGAIPHVMIKSVVESSVK